MLWLGPPPVLLQLGRCFAVAASCSPRLNNNPIWKKLSSKLNPIRITHNKVTPHSDSSVQNAYYSLVCASCLNRLSNDWVAMIVLSPDWRVNKSFLISTFYGNFKCFANNILNLVSNKIIRIVIRIFTKKTQLLFPQRTLTFVQSGLWRGAGKCMLYVYRVCVCVLLQK